MDPIMDREQLIETYNSLIRSGKETVESLCEGSHAYREATFDRATLKEEERTIELSFSSELPYRRWFGDEILSHEKSAVDMARLASGRANLLFNHNRDDYIGVIEEARVDKDKVGRAIVRFGNSDRAQQMWKDVKEGILASVSVGYIPVKMVLTKENKDGPNEYTVTRWQPFEVSMVTVPADPTVGVGRALTSPESGNHKEIHMDPKEQQGNAPAGNNAGNQTGQEGDVRTLGQDSKDNPTARQIEQIRRRSIENLCKVNKIDDRMRDYWISAGLSVDQVAEDMLAVMEERGRTNPEPVTKLGLTKSEEKEFSWNRAISAIAEKDWSLAPFELECSREIAKKLGRAPNPTTFYVPFEVQQRQERIRRATRDLTVGTSSAGGYLVATENIGFIELLRNRSVAFRMGAIRLSGLQGNITVPRQTAAASATWLANEGSTATEAQPTFGQLALSPKTVAAYTEISRQLLLQSSPEAEGIVMADVAASVAIAADLGVLTGSGSAGQPTGITATSGIGSVTGTSLAYAGVLEFQTDIAAGNVMPMAGGYVTTPAVAALMMQRVKFSSTASPLWEGNIWDGSMCGFPAMSSNQMAAATMLYGDWSKVVVGEWGVLEVSVNPFANFQAGIIGIRAMYSMDVGLRYAGAFSYATSIT